MNCYIVDPEDQRSQIKKRISFETIPNRRGFPVVYSLSIKPNLQRGRETYVLLSKQQAMKLVDEILQTISKSRT